MVNGYLSKYSLTENQQKNILRQRTKLIIDYLRTFKMGLIEQEKRLLSVSKLELPKKLYSYDGREYNLEVGKLIGGTGFFCYYFCIFHDDVNVKADTLEECKKKLIIKLNTQYIEHGFIGKEYDFDKHKLKNLPSWCK